MQSAEASFLPPHDEQSSVVCFIPIISKNTPGGEYKGRKSFWFSHHLCKKKVEVCQAGPPPVHRT